VQPQPGHQVFYRGTDRMLGGVCSGLAAGFRIDPLWVRVGFVLLAFLQGVGLVLYIVLWLVMPERVEGHAGGRSGFDSMAADLRRVWAELRVQLTGTPGVSAWVPAGQAGSQSAPPSAAGSAEVRPPAPSSPSGPPPPPLVHSGRFNQSVVLGIVLVAIGLILLGSNLGLFRWAVIWPAALILLGLFLLVRNLEKKR
jgi:phage shock protein C